MSPTGTGEVVCDLKAAAAAAADNEVVDVRCDRKACAAALAAEAFGV